MQQKACHLSLSSSHPGFLSRGNSFFRILLDIVYTYTNISILFFLLFFSDSIIGCIVLHFTLDTYKYILKIVPDLYIKILSFFLMVAQYSIACTNHGILNQPLTEGQLVLLKYLINSNNFAVNNLYRALQSRKVISIGCLPRNEILIKG